MEKLDDFLREIWLECCGHMSSFVNPANKTRRGGMFEMMDAYELLEEGREDEYEMAMEELKGENSFEQKDQCCIS